MTDEDERRRAARAERWFPVEVESGGVRRLAVGRNASASGVLLASTCRFEVGDVVTLRCKLERDHPLISHLTGRVVRYRVDDDVDVFPHRVAVEIDAPAA